MANWSFLVIHYWKLKGNHWPQTIFFPLGQTSFSTHSDFISIIRLARQPTNMPMGSIAAYQMFRPFLDPIERRHCLASNAKTTQSNHFAAVFAPLPGSLLFAVGIWSTWHLSCLLSQPIWSYLLNGYPSFPGPSTFPLTVTKIITTWVERIKITFYSVFNFTV